MHPADKKRISPRYVSALLIFLMSVCIVFVWLRNHDILLDLFDYSTVITAAGKVEHGFKPYTGVRSPMQSSVYLLNYATERVFGRNYLALTLGGLVQALLGALLVRAMLPRSVGPVASTLVALAVTLAGSLQHAVFFYNPLGILCLGIVLLGVAADPQLWPVRRWQTLVVFGALFLGGINKLNFQGATLVLAGLLGLAAWAQGMITGGTWFRNILLLALFGCALPLGFELAWTGATFRQWAADVIMLPAGREAMIRQVLDPGIYLRPLHNYHHHILIRGIAGVGLAVLLVTGGWMLWEARVNRRSVWVLLVRAVLLCAGCVLCALLITTNIETVVLTSLAYLILALALYLQFRQPDRRADLWLGRGLLGATLLWFAVGGYAAWHGSRVLYSLDPPPRSAYVRLEKAPPALSYLNGVRMLPEQIDALQRDAARMAALEDVEGKLPGVLFGPALEWFERAYPRLSCGGPPSGMMPAPACERMMRATSVSCSRVARGACSRIGPGRPGRIPSANCSSGNTGRNRSARATCSITHAARTPRPLLPWPSPCSRRRCFARRPLATSCCRRPALVRTCSCTPDPAARSSGREAVPTGLGPLGPWNCGPRRWPAWTSPQPCGSRHLPGHGRQLRRGDLALGDPGHREPCATRSHLAVGPAAGRPASLVSGHCRGRHPRVHRRGLA
jgi:hypothetical protein